MFIGRGCYGRFCLYWWTHGHSQLGFRSKAVLQKVLLLALEVWFAFQRGFCGGMFVYVLVFTCEDRASLRGEREYAIHAHICLILPAAMTAVIAAKVVDSSVYRDIVFTGMRVTAEEAVKMRLVDQAAPEAEVLPVALEIAGRLESKARDHKTLKELKLGRFGDVLDLCNTAMEFSLPSQRSATGPPRAKL